MAFKGHWETHSATRTAGVDLGRSSGYSEVQGRLLNEFKLKAIEDWSDHQTVIQISEAMEFATTARGEEVAAFGR